MKKHSGHSEITAYTIVALLSAAISFVTMVVLTRTASADFFGKINKFVTASNVVMSLICLGLDSAYIRFYYEPPSNISRKQLAWKCMFPAFIMLIFVSIIITLLRNNPFVSLLIGGRGVFFSGAFIIVIFALFLNRFMVIHFRMSRRIFHFSVVSIALVLLTRTIFIPTYYATTNFEYNVISAALILAIFMSSFFLFNQKDIMELPHGSAANCKSVYRYALFSSPVFLITYLNSYLPQIIISKNLGDSVLGVYSAALLFGLAVQVLCSGFTTFWSPYMYKNYKIKNEIIKNVHDLVLFGSVLILALILIFNDFIYLFVGNAFRKNQNILGMLLIFPIVAIIVETTAYGISIKKKTEISLLIYLISTATNVLLCLFLVSKYSLNGIAIASMLSALIQMILMTYYGQKYYKSINSLPRTLFHTLVLILSAISFYFLYDNRSFFIIAEIVMLVTCLVYDRSIILWSLNLLKSKIARQND